MYDTVELGEGLSSCHFRVLSEIRSKGITESEDAEGGVQNLFEHIFLFLVIWLIHIYVFIMMYLYHHFNLFCTLIFMEREKKTNRVSVGGRCG